VEKKRLRKQEIALLWYATEGHCTDCHAPLDHNAWRIVWQTPQPSSRPPNVASQTFYVKPYSCGAARRRYTPYKLSAQTTLCRLSCSI
jgi:hypothetical protein